MYAKRATEGVVHAAVNVLWGVELGGSEGGMFMDEECWGFEDGKERGAVEGFFCEEAAPSHWYQQSSCRRTSHNTS